MDRSYDFHAGNGIAGSGTDNGNVMVITNYRDTSRSQGFTYDSLNRLTSGWSSANTGNYSWGENYSIDAWGNLQITPMSGKTLGGTFGLSGNMQNRPTGLAYDAAGNLLSYLSASYSYDQENRLSSTAGMSYTYDGNGERVLKSNTSTGVAVKSYWSMGGNTLAEADGSGNLTAEYIYLGSKRIARIDLATNTVHYYLSDHLGSTSIVASAAGAVEEESDYYPFGTEVMVSGPGANEMKFTGKRRDTESQLDYFGARYYSNLIGRWTSVDWSAVPTPVPYADFADPQSLNQYSYVRNIPTSKADFDGHDSRLKVIVQLVGEFTKEEMKPHTEVLDVIGNAVQNFFDEAAHGINQQCGCTPAPTANWTEESTENKKNSNNSQSTNQNASRETGSYTNTHESGRTYSGKGSRARSQASGKRIERQTGDKHTATEWKPSTNDREGFKDESRRIDANGGAKSDSNHNQIESPGKNYRKKDGSN